MRVNHTNQLGHTAAYPWILTLFISLAYLTACEDERSDDTCQLNSDCLAPRICFQSRCMIECIETRDCQSGEQCIESRCQSMNPPPDMSTPPENMRSQCEQARDCQDGEECIDGDCVNIEEVCQRNGDCSSGWVCDRSTRQCIEPLMPGSCFDIDDCFAEEICEAGRCVTDPCLDGSCMSGCLSDTECTEGMICEEGACTLGCSEQLPCEEGLICRMGRCQPECLLNSDCEGQLLCIEQRCRPECVDDLDCEEAEYCIKGSCGIECGTDSECEDSLVCRAGRCEPECEISPDCADGELCLDNLCQEGCLESEDCEDNLVCEDYQCVPECLDNESCAEGQVCTSGACINQSNPYSGSFLISSSTPILRCNELTSINYDPRLAQTTQTGNAFTLFFPSPPTNYVGQINDGQFTVSWSGVNGATEYCGTVTTSNTYVASFINEDMFQGTLNVQFFFQIPSCDCQIQWPIVGVRQGP